MSEKRDDVKDFEEVLAGWRARGSELGSDGLCGGYPVPEVPLMVHAPRATPEDQLGEGVLAWVWRANLVRLGGQVCVIAPKEKFSGANRHAHGSHRTLALLEEHAGEEGRLETACLLTGAVDMSRAAQAKLSGVLRQALARLEIPSILAVWARSNSTVYPHLPALTDLSRTSLFEIGRLMRDRHEAVFCERVALRLKPVAADVPFAMSFEQLESVIANIRAFRNEAAGRDAWQRLEDDELAEVVWGLPVSHLQGVFGISDRGIAKACARRGIASPPRGYWQTLNAGKDPRPVLERNGIRAPEVLMEEFDRRFGKASAA